MAEGEAQWFLFDCTEDGLYGPFETELAAQVWAWKDGFSKDESIVVEAISPRGR